MYLLGVMYVCKSKEAVYSTFFYRMGKSAMSTAIHWTKYVDPNSLQWLPHYRPSLKTAWEQNEASCQKSLYYNLTTLHTSIVIKKQNEEMTQNLY